MDSLYYMDSQATSTEQLPTELVMRSSDPDTLSEKEELHKESDRQETRSEECQTLKKIIEKLLSEQRGRRYQLQKMENIIRLLVENHNKTSSQSSMNTLIQEKDEALSELKTLEQTYFHLHNRYEILSTHVLSQQNNEKCLRQNVADLQERVHTSQEKYTQLQAKVLDRLGEANKEMEKLVQNSEREISKKEAALKMTEIKLKSSDNLVKQKNREIAELSSICDELLAKVNQTTTST